MPYSIQRFFDKKPGAYQVIVQLSQSHILVSSKSSMVELGELIQINTIKISNMRYSELLHQILIVDEITFDLMEC